MTSAASKFLPRARVLLRVLFLGLTPFAFAEERPDRIDETVGEFFRPFEHDQAAMAPDGHYLAMTEHVRAGHAAISLINLDDRTTQRYFIGSEADCAVEQLQWISPARLVFTTRNRGVGLIEVGKPEIKALMVSVDIDAYRSEPILGARSNMAAATPDMPADPVTRSNAAASAFGLGIELRRETSVRDALAQTGISGDLFGTDVKRGSGRALRPFLRGQKPGSPSTILVELRNDGDVFAYRQADYQEVTVPQNVYIAERNAPMPVTPSDVGIVNPSLSQYASYKITTPPPPLVLLELDVEKGRTREIAREELWQRIWLDHQGRMRIALEQQGRRFRYLYRADDRKKWVPLDSVVKSPGPLAFSGGADSLLGARSVPLGFDDEGQRLFFASNVGRDTFSLRSFDLAKGEIEEFEVAHDRYDFIEPTALTAGDALRFDPHTKKLAGVQFTAARRSTKWFDPDLAAVQAGLNKQLAPRRGEIRGWNADRTRFLLDVSGPGDPGGFFVFDATAKKLIGCGDRASWLTEERRNPVHEFDFVTDDRRRLAGFLTLPRQPRVSPPPVLVYFHDGPWFSDPPEFNRGAQALAALGFAVVQLNYRGSSGYGRAHLTGIEGGLDRATLADVQALLTRLQGGKLGINAHLVAALGSGVGGYLAVRMVQLAPETFRCAVAINAPGDFGAWLAQADVTPTMLADLRKNFFGKDGEALRAQSAVAAGPGTKAPVLVVHASDDAYVPVGLGLQLYRAVKEGSPDTSYLELPHEGHAGWSDRNTAKLFAELGRFFNATVYKHGVDVRKPEVVR